MMNRFFGAAGVKSEDRRKLAVLLPVFFLCGISEMLGYNGYMTLFNERFGTNYLPYVYAAEAVILPLEAWFMSRLTEKMRKPELMKVIFLLMGAILALNTILLVTVPAGGGARYFYPFLFLSSSFVVRQQTLLLWSLAIDLCPTQQAKRLMPLFVAAAAGGGIAAGLLAQGVGSRLGAETVYMLAPLFLLAGGINYWRAIGHYLVPLTLKDLHHAGQKGTAEGKADGHYFRRAFTWPYMLTAAAIMTLMPALYFLLEYEFMINIRVIFASESEFAAFFGKVTSLLFTLALAIQLISGRLSARLGPSNMLTAIAVVFTGGFALIALTLGSPVILYTMSLAYMLFYLLLYYFAEPANQMFFKLLPLSERDGFRYVVQGVSTSAGILLGAALQWMHAGLGLGLTVLALVGAGGSVVLVWMARTGRKLYMQELVASVRTMTDAGSMTRDSLLELLRHGGAATILAELLELRNDYARETALELAAQTRLSALQPKVVRLLRDPSARIRIAALKAVDLQRARDDALNEVAALLTDPDYQVRIESVRALGRAVPEKGRIPELLYPMLEDEHPGVVAETVKILYQMQDEASREAYRWVVDHFLSAGGEPVVAICEAIASLRLTEYGSAVARLLKDPSPAVREGAIACLGHLAYAEAIPAMLERLEDSDPLLLEAATKAFVRMGSKAVQPLMDKLLQVSPKLWSAILRALADIMDERDCRSTLVPKVVHMLDDVCSLRDIAETVRLAAGDGLAGLAALRYGELKTLVLDTAWVVLGSLSDDAVAQSIRTAVQDDDEEIRESGLEMLAEGLGDKKLAAAIIKLLDDEAAESDSTKLELGARLDRVGAIRDVWLDKITSAARRGKEKAMDREDRQLLGLLDKVIFLRQVPFFAGLTLEELSRVADIAEERFYSVGARLFTQGESNQTMGVIVEGFVEISTVGEGTRGERALTRLSKAHVYGESSSLYGTLTTASGTVVDGPLHILAINGEALGKLIRLYPGIGIGMLRAAFDRVRRLEQTIAGNAF